MPLNSTTAQSSYSSTYSPPTASSPFQESTKGENEKIQLYNWDKEVKSLKEKVKTGFYKIPKIQSYFNEDVNDIFKEEIHYEISTKFSDRPIPENFPFDLKLFDETLSISPDFNEEWEFQYLNATNLADEHYNRFIAKLANTSGGYYHDKIIDLDNSNSFFNPVTEYKKITLKLFHGECNTTRIAVPSSLLDKLFLSKIICEGQMIGYSSMAKDKNTRIKDVFEILDKQKSDEISFIRLDHYTITKQDYPDLIELFELKSKYKISIWFAGCDFNSEKFYSFDWNRMISLKNPVLFDECFMHESTEIIWKYFRNQVDELTLFYRTQHITFDSVQIENQ